MVGFIVLIWMATIFNSQEYADFGMIYAMQTGVIIFSTAGIIQIMVSIMKERQSRENGGANNFFALFKWSTLFSVMAIFIFGMIGQAEKNNLANFLPLIMSVISGAVLSYSLVASSYHRIEGRHLEAVAWTFFPNFGYFLFGGIGFAFEQTVNGFFCGGLIGCIMPIIILAQRSERAISLFCGNRVSRSHVLDMSPYWLASIVLWLSGYGGIWLISLTSNENEIAEFIFVMNVTSVLQIVATSLHQVWSSKFYQLYNVLNTGELEKKNDKFYLVQGIAIGVFGLLGMLLIKYASGIFLEIRAINFDSLLPYYLMFLSVAISVPWCHAQDYFYVNGEGGKFMKAILVSGLIGIPLWLMTILLIGEAGIYFGYCLFVLSRVIAAQITASKIWHINLMWKGPVAGGVLLSLGYIYFEFRT